MATFDEVHHVVGYGAIFQPTSLCKGPLNMNRSQSVVQDSSQLQLLIPLAIFWALCTIHITWRFWIRMTNSDIANYRLYNQQIATTKFKEPGQIVSWLGAMQAQDYPGAKWSIGLRLPNATDAAIEQAIAARAIVRTWPMRGTLHFVAAEDARWMLQLLTPRIIAQTAGR